MGGRHGPVLEDGGVRFRVFAPGRRVELAIVGRGDRIALTDRGDGVQEVFVADVGPGVRYGYVVDGEGPWPDPASRWQPEGVHGPSEVVDTRFRWTTDFRGVRSQDLVIYELHVGTATPEGTFRALIDRLDDLVDLGVTAIELMPIADFPGDRNWGYDGVAWFAPARCYGRPEDLAALVDAAHARGLAVILDVVFNHFGPSGNYVGKYADTWYTERHHTPWGAALNYDDVGAEATRAFVLEAVRQWIADYRFDGLRLDAAHEIHDDSDDPLVRAIGRAARSAAPGRCVVVIAEDERNEAAVVRSVEEGGLGLDAVWADDLHHVVRRLIAGDDEGYYADFEGSLEELARVLRRGWLYEGQAQPTSGEPRGTSAAGLPPWAFVHCVQNHDQIGNRAFGDRLHASADPARIRAVTALLLLSPYTPLLFAGQEFGASTPFAYFTDHEPELGHLVTAGRRAEFASFRAFRDPELRGRIPDPQDEKTFLRSKLDWAEATRSPGRELRALHRDLLRMRRTDPVLARRERPDVRVEGGALVLDHGVRVVVVALLGPATVTLPASGTVLLDTSAYGGRPATLDGATLTFAEPGAVVWAADRT